MSGMEVTKELSLARIAYTDPRHLPRSGRATQRATTSHAAQLAHTANDHVGAVVSAERDGQPGPRGHGDVVPVRGKFPAQPGRSFRGDAGWMLLSGCAYHHHRLTPLVPSRRRA